MSVQIINQQTLRVNLGALKRCLEKCLRQLNFGSAELSVLLTQDTEIKALNKKHRGKNQPTDILSFGMREYRKSTDPMPPHPEVLGDLVISLETVQRQAEAQGSTLAKELDFIAIHGLLHLLGYDHATPLEKMRMDACHQALLAACRKK
jgi:probable rRNA maturation factor